MLLGKQTLLRCRSLGSCSYRISIKARHILSCQASALKPQPGASSSSSAATTVDLPATNNQSDSHQHEHQQEQPQQSQHTQHLLASAQLLHQTAHRTHKAVYTTQQKHYHHRTHHQPHHRQVHPQPALQVAPMQQFEVVSETPIHSRYLTVYDRRVKFCASENPNECRVLDFDVVGHPRANFCFAVTFPYHPYKDGRKGGEVTLIREYAQGPNALLYCLPTGGLDPKRHADIAECAARELSEEAWLAGGQWHRLIPQEHPGLPEVKWCMNRFVPFLVIDPDQDPSPGSRDAEEASMEVLRVPLEQFRQLMVSGDLMLPSITTAYMALDKLRDEGYL